MNEYYLTLDSRDRNYDDHPDPAAYRIRLPKTYKKVVSARLLGAELPGSFYVFTAARNTTSVRVNGQDVTLPDGNYTVSTIATELKNALVLAFGGSWGVEVDPVTMKLSIAHPEGVSLDTHTDAYSNSEWGLAYFLGFDKNRVYSGTVVTSPRVVNLNPQTYALLDIRQLNGVDESAMDGGEVGSGCFAKVPLDVNAFEYACFRPAEPLAVPQRPVVPKLEFLDVSWRWHDGSSIDFNGAEHSFAIELVCAVGFLGGSSEPQEENNDERPAPTREIHHHYPAPPQSNIPWACLCVLLTLCLGALWLTK